MDRVYFSPKAQNYFLLRQNSAFVHHFSNSLYLGNPIIDFRGNGKFWLIHNYDYTTNHDIITTLITTRNLIPDYIDWRFYPRCDFWPIGSRRRLTALTGYYSALESWLWLRLEHFPAARDNHFFD